MPGVVSSGDWETILLSIDACIALNPCQHLNFVEVGIWKGLTSLDICKHLVSKKVLFTYYGVDPNPFPINMPFTQFQLVKEYSLEAVNLLPPINWVFMDGCHCERCVRNDAMAYFWKLQNNGIMVFHDTSECVQGMHPQTYSFMNGHHDIDGARRGIQVRAALGALNIPSLRPILEFEDKYGTRAFVKSPDPTGDIRIL